MSSKLKKKTRKKKKKSIVEDEGPKIHPRVGNLNLYSEEISKDIIEKIISLVFSNLFKKKMEKKMNDICFDSTKNMINNIMEISNVNHDSDDFDIDKIEINSYVNYNNSDTNLKRYKLQKHNKVKEIKNDIAKENLLNSIEISKNIESYTNILNKKMNDYQNKSTLVEKNKYISLGKFYQFSVSIEKFNFWGHIPCPQVTDIDRTTSNYNNLILKKDKPIKKNRHARKSFVGDKKKSFLKKNTFSYRNLLVSKFSKKFDIIKDKNKADFLASFTPRGKSAKIIEMQTEPLENFETRKEMEGISDLRKEAIELQIKKEKDLKKKVVIIKERKREEDIEKERKIKKGKFTLDNDGNIVIINEIKEDSLPKEFSALTSKQKEVKPAKTSDVIRKEKIKLENLAEKNIEYNKEEEETNTNPFLIKAQMINPLINLNNINDILNNYYKDNEGNFANLNNKNKDYIVLLNNLNKSKVEVSGSNFNLINPSVGVKIKEKDQVKSGGNDFYNKYHKYSINDFNRILQNNIGWENIIFDKKQKDSFNPSSTAEFPNLKQNNLLKNMIKEENESEKEEQNKTEINFLKVKHDFNQKIKNRFIRNKNLGNKIINSKINKYTSSTDLTNIKNSTKKTMLKSSSELFLENEKFIKLKEALLSQNNNDIVLNKIKPYNNKKPDVYNLCEYKNRSLIRQNSIKEIRIKKNEYKDIDNFNRNIIMGRTAHSKITKEKMVLPKISYKNNEVNFNKTVLNFTRERTKKGIWEEYIQKKENDNKKKKVKKINIAKK